MRQNELAHLVRQAEKNASSLPEADLLARLSPARRRWLVWLHRVFLSMMALLTALILTSGYQHWQKAKGGKEALHAQVTNPVSHVSRPSPAPESRQQPQSLPPASGKSASAS